MAKAKAVSAVDSDDIRNPIESARAIASALGAVDKEIGLDHDSLWRLGIEIGAKLDQALKALARFEDQERKAA